MGSEVTRHIADRLLRNHFANKKSMAQRLEIPYHALLRPLRGQSYPKETQRIMNAITAYCMEQHIPPEELFAGFLPIP